MSVSYNRTRKNERMKTRLSNMTIAEYEKLRPNEVKSHKRIVDFIRENDIKLKIGE
jgi:DNA-binding CsgD family transcriptional regulator